MSIPVSCGGVKTHVFMDDSTELLVPVGLTEGQETRNSTNTDSTAFVAVVHENFIPINWLRVLLISVIS